MRKQETNSNASPVIEWSGVRKTYRMGEQEVHALDGVDLVVNSGDYRAVMGPSGSGKSTLLNLLGCLDRPTSGSCRLLGRDVALQNDDQLSDMRSRHLGFIFQSFNLISQLTVRENIELPLFYLGWEAERSAERAVELAEQVGLADRLNHRPRELSGGQQQRTAVARALAADPRILLADEPTGNLDSATSRQIMELLDKLNQQGRTVILVTHEDDIAEHAHNILHMRDGRVERIEWR